MAVRRGTSNNSGILPRLAEKDLYKFWNKLPVDYREAIHKKTFGEILSYVILEEKLLDASELKNIYSFSKEYPDSYVVNYVGTPVMHIVLDK